MLVSEFWASHTVLFHLVVVMPTSCKKFLEIKTLTSNISNRQSGYWQCSVKKEAWFMLFQNCDGHFLGSVFKIYWVNDRLKVFVDIQSTHRGTSYSTLPKSFINILEHRRFVIHQFIVWLLLVFNSFPPSQLFWKSLCLPVIEIKSRTLLWQNMLYPIVSNCCLSTSKFRDRGLLGRSEFLIWKSRIQRTDAKVLIWKSRIQRTDAKGK